MAVGGTGTKDTLSLSLSQPPTVMPAHTNVEITVQSLSEKFDLLDQADGKLENIYVLKNGSLGLRSVTFPVDPTESHVNNIAKSLGQSLTIDFTLGIMRGCFNNSDIQTSNRRPDSNNPAKLTFDDVDYSANPPEESIASSVEKNTAIFNPDGTLKDTESVVSSFIKILKATNFDRSKAYDFILQAKDFLPLSVKNKLLNESFSSQQKLLDETPVFIEMADRLITDAIKASETGGEEWEKENEQIRVRLSANIKQLDLHLESLVFVKQYLDKTVKVKDQPCHNPGAKTSEIKEPGLTSKNELPTTLAPAPAPAPCP